MTMTTESKPVIEVTDLVKKLGSRTILDGINFTVNRGDTLIIMGCSGCGKSTLLRHLIGALQPTSGSVKVFGEDISRMSERELTHLRKRFGMLFQSGALLQSLTVGENVALPILEHSRVDPAIADPFVVHKAINSDERKRQLLSFAQKGSTREALTKEMMAAFEVTLPSDHLMRQFGDMADTCFRQRENLALQNQKLRAARDLLLPRLMSGEVAV